VGQQVEHHTVQICQGCRKTRYLDQHYTWTHWMHNPPLPPEDMATAEKVMCERCQSEYKQAKMRRGVANMAALAHKSNRVRG
jgi:hypothetical protein